MHDEKIKKLEELKGKLIDSVCAEFDKGIEQVNTEEAGAVVDMIKDLADACKNYWKACYYEDQVMENADRWQEYPDGRMGYDRYRYSNGRFAPKGRGSISGYMPPMPSEWMINDDDYQNRMGYGRGGNSQGGSSSSRSSGNGGSSSSSSRGGNNSSDYGDSGTRHGRAYNNYRNSRRHYTESHSPAHRQEMSMHAQEHMDDTMETIRDIWKDSDPELRQRMKTDMTHLMNEMNV